MRTLQKIIILFLLLATNPYIASAQNEGFKVGGSINYFFASSKENACLKFPDIMDFNQMILSDPVIYQSISQSLGGEFMEVLSYDNYSSSRTPSPGILFGYDFNKGIYIRAQAQWMKGTHSRGFSAEYFNMETETLAPVTGVFEARWSEIDFLAGAGYRTRSKVPVIVEGGGLIINKSYSSVEANIANTSFEVADAYKGTYPGFYISAGILVLPDKPVSLELLAHLKSWFKEGQMVTNPGIGISVVWNIGRKEGNSIPVHSGKTNVNTPEMYYPPDYELLFAGEEVIPADPTITKGVPDEFILSKDPDSLELYPGQKIHVFINPEVNSFIIYPYVHIKGKHDSMRIVLQSNLNLSSPQFTFTLPDSITDGYYVAELTYDIEPDGLDTISIPFMIDNMQSQWTEQMTSNGLIVFNELSMDIERLKKRDRDIRKKLDSLNNVLDSTYWDACDDSVRYMQLKKLDKRLDYLPNDYKNAVDDILDSLDRLKNDYPGISDPAGLAQKVKNAEKAAQDCEDKTAALEEELSKNEKKCRELKKKQDAILEKIHSLFTENGFRGSYGYHANGRYHWGYLGREGSANTDYGNLPWEKEVAKLKKELKKLNKEYIKCLKKSKKLPEMIAENKERCTEMQDAIDKAKENQARGNVYASVKSELEQECKWAKRALKKLKEWCDTNPDICHLGDKIDDLLEEDCPETRDEWDKFWDKVKDLLKDKKELEDKLKNDSNDGFKKVKGIEDEIENAETEQKGNLEAIRKLQDERAQRIREERAAAKRDAEAAKARGRAEKEKLRGCIEKLDEWFRKHQDKIDPDQSKKMMERIVNGAGAAGQGAAEAAEKMLKGLGVGASSLSGAGVGAINLAAAILYMYAEHKLTLAANKVVSDHIKNRIEAEAILSKDACGIINVGSRSYFYMKVDGKTIIFSITPEGFDVSVY